MDVRNEYSETALLECIRNSSFRWVN